MPLSVTKLLKEYVQLILNEKARVAPGFSINKLRSLKTELQAKNYVSKYLHKMGQGSSRITFLISSRKILKVALEASGYGQNEAEVSVYTNPSTKNIITKIYEIGPGYSWIVSELVKPFTRGGFKQATGVSFFTVSRVIEAELGNWPAEHREEWGIEELSPELNKFVKAVVMLIQNNDLQLGDIFVEDHWGKSADGRIVLLDYGFTKEVATKYYDVEDSKPSSANMTDSDTDFSDI